MAWVMSTVFCDGGPENLRGRAQALKLGKCPHCGQVGHLLLHGARKGYSGDELVTRAHRVYCCGRRNHRGCGRTFSVMPAALVPQRSAAAAAGVCALLVALVQEGLDLGLACAVALPGRSVSTARRLKQALITAQSAIRQCLSQLVPDPPPVASACPLAQTLAHLRLCFPLPVCAVAAFQFRFQTPFM